MTRFDAIKYEFNRRLHMTIKKKQLNAYEISNNEILHNQR
jgi:hypothetical protein